MPHHAWHIFVFFVEMGFHHVAQAGPELLDSSNLPTSASQSAEIIGVSHWDQPFPMLLSDLAINVISQLQSPPQLQQFAILAQRSLDLLVCPLIKGMIMDTNHSQILKST